MKETKGLIAEFKEFISRGNVLDMAVEMCIRDRNCMRVWISQFI